MSTILFDKLVAASQVDGHFLNCPFANPSIEELPRWLWKRATLHALTSNGEPLRVPDRFRQMAMDAYNRENPHATGMKLVLSRSLRQWLEIAGSPLKGEEILHIGEGWILWRGSKETIGIRTSELMEPSAPEEHE